MRAAGERRARRSLAEVDDGDRESFRRQALRGELLDDLGGDPRQQSIEIGGTLDRRGAPRLRPAER
jgi:hypothetical protein